jgi:hypothetical protein
MIVFDPPPRAFPHTHRDAPNRCRPGPSSQSKFYSIPTSLLLNASPGTKLGFPRHTARPIEHAIARPKRQHNEVAPNLNPPQRRTFEIAQPQEGSCFGDACARCLAWGELGPLALRSVYDAVMVLMMVLLSHPLEAPPRAAAFTLSFSLVR